MKKICIICAGAVRNMVMVSVYTEFFKQHHEFYQYDMVYMDKYHEEELTGAVNNYRIEYDGGTKNGKLFGYTSFIIKATNLLSKQKYDYVIVWGELTATLLYNVLIKNYAGRYCINIRDLFVGKRTKLNHFLFKAIKKAHYVSVSSNKYLEELPKDYSNYIFFHSLNPVIMKDAVVMRNATTNNKKIRIMYIGNIRFYDHLYRLLEEIQNDKRYELYVLGVGSNPIKKYVRENKITNVVVEGAFPKEKTAEFLSKADVIYNLYGTEDINLRMALSNKLYYAVCLNIPILVYRDTYMFEIARDCEIGFAFDSVNRGEFADVFFDWYQNRDANKIKEKCDKLIQEALISQKRLLETLVSGI